MLITASSINLVAILAEPLQTVRPLNRSAIAAFRRAEIVLTTNIPTGNPFPETTLSLRPAFYAAPSLSVSSSSTKDFSLVIPAGSASLSTFSMNWGGYKREQNTGAALELFNNVGIGFWQLKIAVEFQNTEDVGGFVSSSLVAYPKGRLLNNTNSNSTDLSNSVTGSIYNSIKKTGFDIYVTETSTPTFQLFVYKSETLNFYDDVTFPIEINGTPSTTLFSRQPNTIRVEYTLQPPVTNSFVINNVVAMLIKTSGIPNVQTNDWAQAYAMSSKKINNVLNTDYPDNPPSFFVAFNQNDKIKTTGGTNLTLVAGTTYESFFEIDENLLAQGETYRLVLLFQFQDNLAPFGCYHYTVISDELSVTDELEAADPLPFDEIDDYFTRYPTNFIQTSPQHRLINYLLYDGATYNAIRGAGQFTERALNVTVEVYSNETSGGNLFEQIYDQQTIGKDSFGNWIPSGGLSLTEDVTLQTLLLKYEHRLRYEPNQLNIQTRQITPTPNILPSPNSNMNMNGKTVYVRFITTLQKDADTDIYTRTHIIDVDEFDTVTLTHLAKDGFGNPITQLCSDVATICVESTGGGVSPAFSLLDKETYGIANIKEFDGLASGSDILQIQQAPIISSQPAFVANVHDGCIDAQQLDLDTEYRYSLITYGAIYCVDSDANAVIQAMTDLGFPPSITRAALICQTVIALKACGVWDKLDRIWFTACHNELSARIDWKHPTVAANKLIPFNGVETGWTVDNGYTGNGVSWYLDTQFNPSVNGVKYSLTGSGFGMWHKPTGGIEPFAYDTTPTTKGLSGFILDSLYLHDEELRLYQPIPVFSGGTNVRSGYRDGSAPGSICYAYQDGLFHSSISLLTTAKLPEFNWLIMVGTNGATGAPTLFYDSAAFLTKITYLSEYLTDAEHACLYAVLDNYITMLPSTL